MNLKMCLWAAILCFFPTFVTWAGTVNLPQTAQSSCWDASGNSISCNGTRQDGDIRAGSAWPNSRFTDNGDNTLTDALTGLMWTKNAGTPTVGSCTGGSMLWQSALNYVVCLNNASYLGYTDWRLPNVVELQSLVNSNAPDPATWLNSHGYTNVNSGWYWSSTTYVYYTDYAWFVHMYYGSVLYGYKYNYYNYVWPVRAG